MFLLPTKIYSCFIFVASKTLINLLSSRPQVIDFIWSLFKPYLSCLIISSSSLRIPLFVSITVDILLKFYHNLIMIIFLFEYYML